MIFGPVGDERLDANFAYLRSCLSTESRPINDYFVKYDWRWHFPKEDVDAVYAATVENMEKDIAFLERRFGGRKRQ